MKIHRIPENPFKDTGPAMTLVHESEHMKAINFNFKAGQALPLHSHNIEGELALTILEGEGEFLSEDGKVPAKAGDVLVCPISTPHGVSAATDMRVLVVIAPPI
ncbi:Cupin domain-containing protein [Humidesulfovibrio mexicanus]|jgi:quercetin dioxygenase-like cupin family protein|uniref:Cupin domain-containing protein n=1 Tax=Humidesulfovibrio mexicanus TaxID=147047 RepID=A0A239BYX3_9BACT|nr:cupin domain-containing protein [Humidesulfovibrio mexicanus]SNS12294.1 Cupin domain-containing protein [Humidesulfovibrio mexicanus]